MRDRCPRVVLCVEPPGVWKTARKGRVGMARAHSLSSEFKLNMFQLLDLPSSATFLLTHATTVLPFLPSVVGVLSFLLSAFCRILVPS